MNRNREEKHEQEIRSTRVGGFGGSDAATLVTIAERIAGGLPLTTTQKHRVRVAKGLETPPPPFSTPEIASGRAFEDEVAAEIESKGWDRESYCSPKPNTMTEPVNFKVFAHADFMNLKTNSVKECKWSRKFSHKGLQKEYRWQLQWYYMLGADSVSLVSDTADGREVSDIKRDENAVDTLRKAVYMLDAAWQELDLNITEFAPDELPPEIKAIVDNIEAMTRTMEQDEERLKAKKAELMEWMRDKATAIEGERYRITYTPASHSVGFDAKAFEKEHPDMFAAYRTKETKKTAYITIKSNKNNK